MSQELTAGTGTETGEPVGGTVPQTTAKGTGTGDGQPQAGAIQPTTKPTGTDGDAEEFFFDPSILKDHPELQAPYKQMLKAG